MLSACLICSHNNQVANCALLDISAMGAKVRFDKSSGDGEHVDLSLRQRLMIEAFIDFPVGVMWQDGPVVGLRFLSDPQEVAVALRELLRDPFDGVENFHRTRH